MSDSRDRLAESIEEMIAAIGEAREAIQATELVVAEALESARQGGDVNAMLEALRPAETRRRVNETLGLIEKRRHVVRRRVFAVGLDEGLTIGAMSRSYGFSRQLAARYAKEEREERDGLDGQPQPDGLEDC